MSALAWLMPVALSLGLIGLAGFLWSLKSGQFDDLEGAAYRILEDDGDRPEGQGQAAASAELPAPQALPPTISR
jgi:cbb3-type cytochrome oxidase maturation protein